MYITILIIHSFKFLLKIHPSMYASGWFITLYSKNFPFDILCRIWDLFLLQGMKIIFKIAIALLTLFEKDFLALNFEDTMDKFGSMYNDVEKNSLIQCAIGLKITNKTLEVIFFFYKMSSMGNLYYFH